MIDEGVIKFNCEWIKTKSLEFQGLKELNFWRKKLFHLCFIGVYKNSIAFGNISARVDQSKEFIISGTQTGGLPELTAEHYARVLDYSIERNWIRCQGPVKASSESLTHAMIYELDRTIGAVVHVHHRSLWKQLMAKVPTTDKKISYGTPEMALEVKWLYQNADLRNQRILIMAGHEEGIITFGRNLEEATEILFRHG